MHSTRPSPRRLFLEFFGVTTFIGLLNTNSYFFNELANKAPDPYYWIFIIEMTGAYALLPVAPLFYWFYRRFPIKRSHIFSGLLIHLVGCVCFSILHTSFMWVSRELVFQAIGKEYSYGVMQYRYLMEFHKDVLVYWLLVGALALIDYVAANRERELRTAQIEARLNEARLEALKMQLNPHFLFNTLNTISSIMYKDVRIADKMIADLSRFLRLTLDHSGEQYVDLKKEIDFLELYLDIMKARFRDRLRVFIRIEPTSAGAEVPNLILQPLVENAIKHAQDNDRIEIHIRAHREAGHLVLTMTDNGPGLPEGELEATLSKGVGLSNTIARLRQMYGDDHELSFTNRDEGGLAVEITIPFHERPVSANHTEEEARAAS